MNEEQPIRERQVAHECVCLLLHFQGRVVDGVALPPVEDKCRMTVLDPDSPFCRPCEDALHPQATAQGWRANHS